MRLERVLHELRIGDAPAQPARTPTWPRSTRPKRPARPAIWASSGRQVAARLPVELGRLREQQGLAGEVHAVPEDVRRHADVSRAREKRSISSRREASGIAPVEDRDAARMQPVHLAGEREAALRLNATTTVPSRASGGSALRPLRRRLPLEDLQLGLRECPLDEAGARRARRGGGPAGSHPRGAAASRRSRAPRRRPCTSSMTRSSPDCGAISTVQQRIGALVHALLARDQAVLLPPLARACGAPPASMRSGPAYCPTRARRAPRGRRASCRSSSGRGGRRRARAGARATAA